MHIQNIMESHEEWEGSLLNTQIMLIVPDPVPIPALLGVQRRYTLVMIQNLVVTKWKFIQEQTLYLQVFLEILEVMHGKDHTAVTP